VKATKAPSFREKVVENVAGEVPLGKSEPGKKRKSQAEIIEEAKKIRKKKNTIRDRVLCLHSMLVASFVDNFVFTFTAVQLKSWLLSTPDLRLTSSSTDRSISGHRFHFTIF